MRLMGVLDQIRAGGSPANKSKHAPRLPAQGEPNPVVSRDAQGRLLPGRSLNPRGRPKTGVEARFREYLEERGGQEQLSFEEWCGAVASGEIPVDWRMRWEVGRWMHERAHGKALERSVNANLELGQGQAAPAPRSRLSAAARQEMLRAVKEEAAHNSPQLPAGEVLEGEFRSADLPSTDPMPVESDKEQ